MKNYYRLLLLTVFALTIHLNAQTNVNYGENFIAFEAEDTATPFGNNWKVRTPTAQPYLNYLYIQ